MMIVQGAGCSSRRTGSHVRMHSAAGRCEGRCGGRCEGSRRSVSGVHRLMATSTRDEEEMGAVLMRMDPTQRRAAVAWRKRLNVTYLHAHTLLEGLVLINGGWQARAAERSTQEVGWNRFFPVADQPLGKTLAVLNQPAPQRETAKARGLPPTSSTVPHRLAVTLYPHTAPYTLTPYR